MCNAFTDFTKDRPKVRELKEKIERLNKVCSNMSAELTYLRGVINCAMGKYFPSDIGCEHHPLNAKEKKK